MRRTTTEEICDRCAAVHTSTKEWNWKGTEEVESTVEVMTLVWTQGPSLDSRNVKRSICQRCADEFEKWIACTE